ncbi:MAG TPA: hypothetical protein VMY38_01665 [Gemmatimonadaceae bacterium]|nr:hypothetical protein [Gemmatimonadaceae bacterium]
MFVSPRFRDIFSSKPIATRKGDRPAEAGREAISDAEFGRRADELAVNLIWLEIAEAHRRAARAFTPTHNLAVDLAE